MTSMVGKERDANAGAFSCLFGAGPQLTGGAAHTQGESLVLHQTFLKLPKGRNRGTFFRGDSFYTESSSQ